MHSVRGESKPQDPGPVETARGTAPRATAVGARRAARDDDEGEILRRIQAGDRDAFAEVYASHAEAVTRFIRRRVFDRAEAEDLTHETFVEALRSIDRFEGRSHMRTWLCGIARHVVLRFFRFGRRWMTTNGSAYVDVDRPVDARVESRVDAAICLERIGEIVDRGSQANARVFLERHAMGVPISVIADEVGVTYDAVKASLRRTRSRLRDQIPELEQVLEGTI